MLEDRRVSTRAKLSALWASTLFCYVYGDYFGLYVAGTVAEMNRGRLAPLGQATAGVLVGVSLMMAVPSVMVALSLLLPARVCRWACIMLGVAYTAIVAVTLPGSEPFYMMLSAIEMASTLAIAVVAWRWPREAAHG